MGRTTTAIILLCVGATGAGGRAWGADAPPAAAVAVVRAKCLDCHSTTRQEGEFDLEQLCRDERLGSAVDAAAWEQVLDQISLGQMPPSDAPQLSAAERTAVIGWVRGMLDAIATAQAGDPGPVVLRRLSNHEYDYSVRDLTRVDTLDPTREFPVDGAAGEGFTNAGAGLVMSPALLAKYLEAAKQIARHMVLLDDGVRFSSSDSPQDWTAEVIADIRRFYARHTVATEVLNEVEGTGRVRSEAGGVPLTDSLAAVQGHRSREGLSPKYLAILERALRADDPSPVLDPLRRKFREGRLAAADIEAWHKPLWKFNPVGHLGRPNGPTSWQEPVSPLVSSREFRVALESDGDTKVFLVAGTAGDGDGGDDVVWVNPRIMAKGRPDIPLGGVAEVMRHLEMTRARLLPDAEACLAALAEGHENAPPESLPFWRAYVGSGAAALEPLLARKQDRTPDYAFIQGWHGDRDMSVQANSSDTDVRTPGLMRAHGIAMHPAPDRDVVVAWKSPVTTSTLRISGQITHAHPECGNGVTWALEVRRGTTTERMAAGVLDRGESTPVGPFDGVTIEVDQAVALVIGPRDKNHFCDLTAVDLELTDGPMSWNLAREVSPNILAGNPHGAWHFLSQAASSAVVGGLPEAVVAWRRSPSSATAARVRTHVEQDVPLTHPLLFASAMASLPAPSADASLKSRAPGVLEVDVPAALSRDAEFVVTGRLADAGVGSVQLQVATRRPDAPGTELVPHLPVIVGDDGPERRRLEAGFAEHRALFPVALCYARIVPVDEVVTLVLYHREDEPLRRLMLAEEEALELDRLWRNLMFVSEAPLKQVTVFEQIYQFATQDRPDLVKEFAPLREPIVAAAEAFRVRQERADAAQRQAVIDLATRAWRRPLTSAEVDHLQAMPPRLMLARVLTSPAFLYRAEKAAGRTGPVSDWELATRLSYFLWSSLPDDELRSVAAAGSLRDPDVLAAQARRMLRDGRVRRLATEFGCQYLHVRDVATLDEKSERHFPTFAGVREALQEEVTLFFIDLFQHDRSVVTLLDADHSFLDRSLAEHYGIPFTGDGWQRVDGLRGHGRGGVLGFGATLAKHSGASRTSAILRGTWVSEVLLGDRIPNPPKGVPTLPEEPSAGLSERQLIERHSNDARCSGCHRRIDPYGFALEAFDAIGRRRDADARTVLHDGTAVDGLDGLRTSLVRDRQADFLRQFSRKLLGYALGRSVQLSDQPLLDDMVAAEGHRVGDLVERIVRSPQFREIRGTEPSSMHTE